ncbi:MAG: aminotransferase class V-fold PLP-dependent enzyme, partial [bacterium]
YRSRGRRIITAKTEHPAILKTAKLLEKEGFRITYLDVDRNGTVDLQAVEEAIDEGALLISIMYANNETGTVQPIKEIGALARQRGVLFHTDAVQAVGKVPIDLKN